MLSFNQKRQLRRLWASPLVQILLGIVLVFSSVSAYGRYSIAAEMAKRRLAAEEAVAELEVRKAALAAQVAYITSERGQEAEMRRQFDIAREGEQVVIILDEPVRE
jgi:zona occludens toxin (predicted ATPase)